MEAYSISSVDISTNAIHYNQTIGGIVGIVENSATVANSYVEGNINNAISFGRVGGVAGFLWILDFGRCNNTGH